MEGQYDGDGGDGSAVVGSVRKWSSAVIKEQQEGELNSEGGQAAVWSGGPLEGAWVGLVSGVS